MGAEDFELVAELRELTGKGTMHRIRCIEDKVPGIIYGAGKDPQSITLLQRDLLKAFKSEIIFSSIIDLKISDKRQKVVLKALQRHPTKLKIMHIDFQRVRASEKLIMNVPLHFILSEKAPGVKEGGIISHLQTEIEIRCLPGDLPEFIEINLSQLKLDESLHLSDVKLPLGVELTSAVDEEHDLAIASIHLPKVSKVDIAAESAGTAFAEGIDTEEKKKVLKEIHL